MAAVPVHSLQHLSKVADSARWTRFGSNLARPSENWEPVMKNDIHSAKKHAGLSKARTASLVILALSAPVTMVWGGTLLYGAVLIVLAALARIIHDGRFF